jgi:hypothetical protein
VASDADYQFGAFFPLSLIHRNDAYRSTGPRTHQFGRLFDDCTRLL